MDIDAVEWRIFEDINMSNISSASYAAWAPVPSGLNSSVRLVPLSSSQTALKAEVKGMRCDESGDYYLVYALSIPGGKTVSSVSMTDRQGTSFTGFTTAPASDGTVELIVRGILTDGAAVDVTDEDGQHHFVNVVADGPYAPLLVADFTADAAPGGGWQKMSSTSAIKGFSGTGKLSYYKSKLSGTMLSGLYEGLTFGCETSIPYYFYVGYGMNAAYDFWVTVDDARGGDVCLLSYLRGEGPTVYVAADSLLVVNRCADTSQGITLPLTGYNSSTVYRSLTVYRPKTAPSALTPVVTDDHADGLVYTLQGQRVARPGRGIYIQNGRKVIGKSLNRK